MAARNQDRRCIIAGADTGPANSKIYLCPRRQLDLSPLSQESLYFCTFAPHPGTPCPRGLNVKVTLPDDADIRVHNSADDYFGWR